MSQLPRIKLTDALALPLMEFLERNPEFNKAVVTRIALFNLLTAEGFKIDREAIHPPHGGDRRSQK